MKHSIKKHLFFFASFFLVQTLFAQDVIIMKNGDELQAKVLEVGAQEIKYKRFDNLEGPTYSAEKGNVFMIRYENGSKDVFKSTPELTQTVQTNERSDSPPAELPRGSFNINPLGFLQFGPIFQYETKISPRTYLVPHFRYSFAGVVTHAIWTGFDEDSELSAGSAAIGLGVKNFDSADDTWYYGGLLDFSWTTARYDVSESDATEQKATNLAIVPNFGYRWRSGRGTYVNLGLLAGFAFALKDEERYISTGELYATDDGIAFFGMLELSFGWDSK